LSRIKYNYININDLFTIKLLRDRSIMIEAAYMGYDSGSDQIYCTLVKTFETEQDFYDIFPLQKKADLKNISESCLLKKFDDGDVFVWCFLELGKFGGNLVFKKKNGMLWAVDEYFAKELPVSDKVCSAADFVEFTLRYNVSRSEWEESET